MARGMNHVFLIGALAREPEMRYTQNGTAIFEAVLAGEDEVIGNDGKVHNLPWYHRIQAIGRSAEWYKDRNLQTGQGLMVEGSLDYSQWEDQNGGGKRSAIRVRIDRLEGLGYEPELVQDASGGVRMRNALNEVFLIGNLARDPDLRYTQTGVAVMKITVAVNQTWRNAQGEQQEKTHWIDVETWREQAEALQNLRKGDAVLVQGRIKNESWTDKDGNKRNNTKIEATRVEALARGAAPAQSSGYAAATPAAPRPQTASSSARPQQGGYGQAPSQPARANTGSRSGGLDIDQGLDDFPPEEDDLPF